MLHRAGRCFKNMFGNVGQCGMDDYARERPLVFACHKLAGRNCGGSLDQEAECYGLDLLRQSLGLYRRSKQRKLVVTHS
jgi:hypothetical protein